VTPTRRHCPIIRICAAALLVLGLDKVAAQGDEVQELQAVEGELRVLEERLEDQRAERDAGLQALKGAELEVAAAAAALRDVRSRLEAQAARQQALIEDSRQAQTRLDTERAALAQQIRMNYAAGRQEGLKLLLNQDTPARLGRMVAYYDYLNRERTRRLEAVEVEIVTLTQLENERAELARDLNQSERSRADNLSALESSRDSRRTVLASLERDIESSGDAIQRLREEAQRLAELVEELSSSRAAFPPDAAGGFPGVAGELDWPVSGSIVSDFGDTRAGGQLRWNGVVVGAPGGTPVRAVYHGRIAYADWLPGLGLLIIVDHGAGYMSLYGHNEDLLKSSGDWVVPGEVIGHVGDSGGQTQTALYFEIRRDGEPLDPHPWMAESLRPAR